MQVLICYSFTCACLFLLAFIAFFNPVKVNIVANRWFSLFLFSVGCMLLNAIIYQYADAAKYNAIIAINELSRFAMAPALYLSVLNFTSPNKSFRKIDYLHFAPFAIFFILIAPGIFHPSFRSHQSKSGVISYLLSQLVFFSVKIQLIIYWILSFYKLNRHQKNIRLVNSTIKPVDLTWLRLILIGIVCMILLWLNDLFFKVEVLSAFAPFGYVTTVLFICYYLLAQTEIYPFENTELEDITAMIINSHIKVKEVKERLNDEQLNSVKNRLISLMENEKIFLDNELNLPQLSKRLAISPHDLSYTLNRGFNKNFFEFVNAYRVAEAKKLMLSDKYKDLNILGIAYSSGFNSKTTFNISFKKETQLSPTQFIQQYKPGSTSQTM